MIDLSEGLSVTPLATNTIVNVTMVNATSMNVTGVNYPELNVTSTVAHQNMFAAFASVFAVDSIRILQTFLMGSIFGPILLMVGEMTRDLRNIISLTVIFIFSYGVTLLGVNYILNPDLMNSEITLLKVVLNCPFYHLFGEHMTENEYCWPESNRTDTFLVAYYQPTLRGFYLMTTVILLFNLLIAMFNSTITKVEARSERLWYLHRRDVILENWNRSCFPFAPFLLIQVIFSCLRKIIARTNWNIPGICQGEPTYFSRKMLSASPARSEAKKWFSNVNEWEMLVFHRVCREIESKAQLSLADQLREESQNQQEFLDARLREARMLSAREMNEKVSQLEKDMSIMMQRKLNRMKDDLEQCLKKHNTKSDFKKDSVDESGTYGEDQEENLQSLFD